MRPLVLCRACYLVVGLTMDKGRTVAIQNPGKLRNEGKKGGGRDEAISHGRSGEMGMVRKDSLPRGTCGVEYTEKGPTTKRMRRVKGILRKRKDVGTFRAPADVPCRTSCELPTAVRARFERTMVHGPKAEPGRQSHVRIHHAGHRSRGKAPPMCVRLCCADSEPYETAVWIRHFRAGGRGRAHVRIPSRGWMGE